MQPPDGFELYLEIMLRFFKHQSQVTVIDVLHGCMQEMGLGGQRGTNGEFKKILWER